MNTAKTQVERNETLQANNAKKGLVQVKVWIPEDRREEFLELAAKMREEKEAGN